MPGRSGLGRTTGDVRPRGRARRYAHRAGFTNETDLCGRVSGVGATPRYMSSHVVAVAVIVILVEVLVVVVPVVVILVPIVVLVIEVFFVLVGIVARPAFRLL